MSRLVAEAGCLVDRIRRLHRWRLAVISRLAVAASILVLTVLPVQAQSEVIDFATEDPDLLIAGLDEGDRFGNDLAAGDLDGDGVDDLVIGAPWAASPGNRGFAGHAYVFFGGEERSPSLNGEDADVIIFGAEANDALGGSHDLQPTTMAIGDVDSDGFGDLVLGAPGLGSGKVHIVFGRSRSSWDLAPAIDLAEADAEVVTVEPDDANDFLGIAVTVGDFNGDGLDDVAAGAWLADGPNDDRTNAGEVFVFFGRDRGSWTPRLVAPDDADARVIGALGSSTLGSGLAVGEFGGTDAADLVMGAAGGAGGSVHVLFGSTELSGTRDLADEPADWVVGAGDPVDEVGSNLAVGDVNGDGQDDLVVGAPGGDGPTNGRMDAGEVSVLFGPRTSGTTSNLAADADFLLYGPQGLSGQRPGGRLGEGVAVGDYNGDGAMDILAGARSGDGAGDALDKSGEAYVVFGGDLPPSLDLDSEDADIAIYGQHSEDFLGRGVTLGSLMGLGPADLILGADRADVTGDEFLDSAGKVFIVFQQAVETTPTATTTITPTGTGATSTPTATATATGTRTPATPTQTATRSPTPTPTATATPSSLNYLPLILNSSE